MMLREKLGLAGLALALFACNTEKEGSDPPNPPPAPPPASSGTPPATPSTPSPPGASPAGAAATTPPSTSAGSAPIADGTLIEAGCSYDARQLSGADGSTYRVTCPAGCEKEKHNVFGSGVYTEDTPICKAGIHSGAIPAEGGTVTVRLEPGRPAYRGSNQNGVKSRDYGKYRRSYAVITAATAAASPSAADPAVIEAGCTYNGNQLDGNEGAIFRVACAAGCEKGGHNAYGTGVYTADTPICKAGVHAGAIPASGGIVSVRIEPGRRAYRGSEQNGIQSRDYGKYRWSYSVITAESAARPAPDPSLIEAGCTYDADQLEGADGATFRVSCPAGCEKGGHGVYGTDIYTADTPICRAAVHAGAVGAEGGTLTVRLEPGRPAYRGSEQNGIKSRDYGKYRKSYAVVRP